MVRTARVSMPSAKKNKTSSLIYSMDRENEVSKTFIIKNGKLFFIPTIDRFLSFLLRRLVDKYLLLNFNKKGFIYLFGSVLNEKKLRKLVHHTGFKKMWIYLWDKSAISNSVLYTWLVICSKLINAMNNRRKEFRKAHVNLPCRAK